MKEAVDPKLRDQQTGFRRIRSCADQIASLCIIVEQSLEWKSPLYINFIDYEKVFDSIDRETMWKLLRHYGVPEKIISLIRCHYQADDTDEATKDSDVLQHLSEEHLKIRWQEKTRNEDL